MKNLVKGTKDFPKPGVVYWDFTPLLTDPITRKEMIQKIAHHFKNKGISTIACIESKGFILGSLLANAMELPMVLIRKPGLTPGAVHSHSFVKEYGEATYEMAENRLNREDRVLVVYDILAGPGATQAAIKLIQQSGAQVLGCAYTVELSYLHGREHLHGLDVYSLVSIQQEEKDAVLNHQF